MRAARALGASLCAMSLVACKIPAISAEGAKVQLVTRSTCPAVGNFISFRLDPVRALNYQSFKKQMVDHNANVVRDKAFHMGGDQVVEVFTFPDKPTQLILSLYSVHKCQK
jgi:hypothetical protein